MANEKTQEVVEIREGPAHLDPNKLIDDKQVSDKDSLIQHLRGIAKGKDPVKRMEDFVDSLYGNFKTNVDVDTRITASEFAKYELLYSSEARKEILDGTASSELIQTIMELSDEFYRRVNTQRPIHIVDDVTGRDICPPLPPIFNSLNTLHGKGSEAVAIFHNAFDRSDGVKGGMGELQVQKASANLQQMLLMAQDQETLLERISATDELADNFHRQVFGKSVFPDAETSTKTSNEGSTTGLGDDDMFDFNPDPVDD